MIRDQLIEKTNNTFVRERLLLEDDDLTLEKAVILACQIESAAQCAAKLNTAHESSVSSRDMLQECTQVHGAEAEIVCLRVQTYNMHTLKFSSDVETVAPLDSHHVPLTVLHEDKHVDAVKSRTTLQNGVGLLQS